MQGDRYSRLVAWAKIALPLLALAILSTLFLLSKSIDPNSAIPFAEREINDRIRDQQVTGPFFSGMTTNGDRIAFTASEVSAGSVGANVAENLSAQIDFANGGRIAMVADRGAFDIAQDTAALSGGILIESSTGYVMRSDTLNARLSVLDVTVPDTVTARGPAGNLTAGALRITAQTEGGGAQLLFTNGVKLIYDPQEFK